jgi:hypothetical protein
MTGSDCARPDHEGRVFERHVDDLGVAMVQLARWSGHGVVGIALIQTRSGASR